jgi:hypothetical protein
MHEFGSNGTIDSSADRTNDNSLWPTYLTDTINLFTDEFFLETKKGLVSFLSPDHKISAPLSNGPDNRKYSI